MICNDNLLNRTYILRFITYRIKGNDGTCRSGFETKIN